MQKKKVTFDIEVYSNKTELSPEDAHLLEMAIKAGKKAYAPYSNFQVGAAVLLEDGTIVLGNNQENASYPAGLCAERVAMFYAGANYPGTAIKSIAVTASSKTKEFIHPAGPCGSCRQAMAEYEQKQKTPISIIMGGASGEVYKCNAIQDLLPLAFNSSFLSDS
mgnify:CR=1 FL=1